MSSPPRPSARPSIRPLLKWAGGKRQLLTVFRRFYPERPAAYREPFVGSGAVFFDLLGRGALENVPVALTDSNEDLIGCYLMVRDSPGAVVAALDSLDRRHARDGAACYYAVRDRFNVARGAARAAGAPAYTAELAAMLIYLNRTGFNGLFRLNAGGSFNVPTGRYAKPRICDPELVHAVSAAFSRGGVTIRPCAFDAAVADVAAGEFVYFDPPYAPVSPTSTFGAYTAGRFTDEDQRRLCSSVVDLARRGCAVMLSNSSAPGIAALYTAATRVAGSGLRLWQVPARRAINSRPARRGAVIELLLTNLEPRGRQEGIVAAT